MYSQPKRMAGTKNRKKFEKQMMRHMFSTFLLWLISKGQTHGYEIITKLKADDGLRIVTASQLYPLLKIMAKQGLIIQRKEMHGRRVRKLYRITEKGKEALREAKRHFVAKPLKRQFLKEMVG